MAMNGYVLTLLLAASTSLAACLHNWFLNWEGNRSGSGSILTVLMGDSRRIFANHFFAKADVYFHRGYYPSIFDSREAFEKEHEGGGAGMHDRDAEHSHEHEEQEHSEHNHGHCDHHEHNPAGKARDWIEAFNRHFTPSVHTELTDESAARGTHMEGEILPWLWLSAELDPQHIETYTVASFWLSEHIGRTDEAIRFLRQGLRENPNSYEILFELGRLYEKHRNEHVQARNVWELGLRKWREQEQAKSQPDWHFFEKFTAHLARLEEKEGNLRAALSYLEMLRPHTPEPRVIQQQIDELKLKLGQVSAATSS
jgi:tetratricopeptide (TPR) repeat protein